MANRPIRTQADIVRGALAFVEEHGVDALTLRALGDSMGLHHTAIYRYFPSKDDLTTAMFDAVIGEALVEDDAAGPASGRERVSSICRALRHAFQRHPGLMLPLILGAGTMPKSQQMQRRVLAALREMGLEGTSLTLAYQAIESYAIGGSVYDFSGAPNHLEMRRLRHRLIEDPAFDDVSRTTEQITELNATAFEFGLTALLDAAVNAARLE